MFLFDWGNCLELYFVNGQLRTLFSTLLPAMLRKLFMYYLRNTNSAYCTLYFYSGLDKKYPWIVPVTPLATLWLGWLGSLVVRALDLRLDGRELDSTAVFHQATLGQLSLLPSVGRKTSTSQSAVTLCGWGPHFGWGVNSNNNTNIL